MNKKVLFFIYTLGMGGAERILSLLSKHLPTPYTTTFVVHSQPETCFAHRGEVINYDLPRFRSKIIMYVYAILRNVQVILKGKPALIVSTLQFMDLLVLISVMLLRLVFVKVPKVIVRIESAREVKRPTTWRQKFLVWLFRYVDAFIVVSEQLKPFLIANFSIPTEKIHCIYNGVEIANTPVLPYEKREFLYDIISIGRMVEAKDHVTMLHTIKELVTTHRFTELRVCIVGGGNKEKEIHSLAKSLQIEKYISFMGTLDFEQGQALLLQSKLFLLTSKWEGFGIVLIEAMSKGLPIVSTNCNFGPNEVLASGKYGVLVPVGEPKAIALALAELLMDTSKLNQLSELSTVRANFFDMKKIAEQHRTLFDALLKTP